MNYIARLLRCFASTRESELYKATRARMIESICRAVSDGGNDCLNNSFGKGELFFLKKSERCCWASPPWFPEFTRKENTQIWKQVRQELKKKDIDVDLFLKKYVIRISW